MAEVFRNVLNASVQGSVLIGVALIFRLLLKRGPRLVLCAMWVLVGLRLLLPFTIESNLSLQPKSQMVTREQWRELQNYGQVLENIPVDDSGGAIPSSGGDATLGAQRQETKRPSTVTQAQTFLNWVELIPFLWAAGAGVMGLYLCLSYLRLRRQVRDAVKWGENIWESDRVDTAFILGYIRPRIYLPMGMTEENREMILYHERTHLRRGDHWIKLLGFAALAIHWFNPLVWLAFTLLGRDVEVACDERVVRSMDLDGRKRYSAALLSCSANKIHFGACPVAFGEKPVRRRILSVLQYRKPGFWVTLGGMAAVFLMAVCFLTSPGDTYAPREIPQQQYTESDAARRVAEPKNPTIIFDGHTLDIWTDFAAYRFDPMIPASERDACVFYVDAILAHLDLEWAPDIVVLSEYEGAWTDGSVIYLGEGEYDTPDYGARLIVNALGGYVNYGGAYGYARYIAQQEGWHTARIYRPVLTHSDARDLNWLCFREEFVSRQEIEANRTAACAFAETMIGDMGEADYVRLLKKSGDVVEAGAFNDALSRWYDGYGLDYQPTQILYAIGGDYHDYAAKCFYATFYMPRAWENRHYSNLAKDGNFLHESYSDVKLYFETAASQMEYIQRSFGVHEDTSDIDIEFLLSGTGGTWAARNQIMLHYHAYIPRSYINMMLYRHTVLREGRMNYDWIYHGIGEYLAQMGPSEYEDAVLLYSVDHENPAYSTLEGDWYTIWQKATDGETDPDVLWRKRWDLLAYYYDREIHNGGYGQVSFTAYLIDQLGLQTVCDYLLATENPCPDIDFAYHRAQWESYLNESYGQYPTYEDYIQ